MEKVQYHLKIFIQETLIANPQDRNQALKELTSTVSGYIKEAYRYVVQSSIVQDGKEVCKNTFVHNAAIGVLSTDYLGSWRRGERDKIWTAIGTEALEPLIRENKTTNGKHSYSLVCE